MIANRIVSARDLADTDDGPLKVAVTSCREDGLTCPILCELEPRLRQLERDIRCTDVPKGSALRIWYRDFKCSLLPLVGWERRDPDPTGLLSGMTAYNLAYFHLSGLLHSRERGRSLWLRS
jgi:hypothetical protein